MTEDETYEFEARVRKWRNRLAKLVKDAPADMLILCQHGSLDFFYEPDVRAYEAIHHHRDNCNSCVQPIFTDVFEPNSESL